MRLLASLTVLNVGIDSIIRHGCTIDGIKLDFSRHQHTESHLQRQGSPFLFERRDNPCCWPGVVVLKLFKQLH